MENSKNTDCWYIDICEDDCSSCLTYKQMKWQFDNSGLPKSKYKPIKLAPQQIDRSTFKHLAEIRKDIVSFVDNGNNLYICGHNPGNGKTSWAIKMLQTYFHYTAEGSVFHLRGMFVSVPTLLLKFKDFDNPLSIEFKDNLQKVDLLILDDVAVTGLTQYDYLQLFSLVDQRMLAGKSIVFTSNNISLRDLEESVGARLASRIWRNSEVVEIKGGDMRD